MLGLTSISGAPISTSFFNPNVTVNVTGNALTLAIGSSSALAGALVQPTGSPLTLGFGSLTISGAANVTPTATPFTLGVGTVTVTAAANVSVTGNQLTIGTGSVTVSAVLPTGSPMTLTVNDAGIITWNDIDPGATMVWTPIDPY